VHDSTVLKATSIIKHPHRFFTNSEYLLGNSSYPSTTQMLVQYKLPHLTVQNMKFNEIFSGERVVIEHVMGLVKGRWSSLRGMRLMYRCKKDLKQIKEWIVCCLILHNMLNDSNDEWEEQANIQVDEDVENNMLVAGIHNGGWTMRERIKAEVFEYNGYQIE